MVDTPKKLLIAEDEKPLAKALELKLTHAGFITKTVYNGKDALSVLQKEKFDLLLLDLVMPETDGFTVLKKLREQNITIPVIVLSNLSQTEDEHKVRALGIQEFFVKSNTSISYITNYIKQILIK